MKYLLNADVNGIQKMESLEFPVSADYVESWGVYEALRELLQNAKDAEVESGIAFCMYREGSTLYILNRGISIKRDSLILGVTTKRNRNDLIGEHGEGLILGVLALLRCGKTVTIQTNYEVWSPSTRYSEKWLSSVLHLDIDSTPQEITIPYVSVVVNDISDEDMELLYSRIRWLPDARVSRNEIDTDYCTILLEPSERGRVYVKGIFIEDKENLAYGYDLKNANVGRDRSAVSSRLLHINVIRAIDQAFNSGKIDASTVLSLFEVDYNEFRYHFIHGPLLDSSYHYKVLDEVAQQWAFKHDTSEQQAIPVRNLNEVNELAHWGLRGVIVPSTLMIILGSLGRSKDVAIRTRAESLSVVFDLSDLLSSEYENYTYCLSVLNHVWPESSNVTVKIASFKTDHLRGIAYLNKDSTKSVAYIRRSVLATTHDTFRTMIHELSHVVTRAVDGQKLFHACVEDVWCKVCAHLQLDNSRYVVAALAE